MTCYQGENMNNDILWFWFYNKIYQEYIHEYFMKYVDGYFLLNDINLIIFFKFFIENKNKYFKIIFKKLIYIIYYIW